MRILGLFLLALIAVRCVTARPAPHLESADEEFARDTASRGAEGWVEWFAPNGVQLHGNGSVSVGHEQIRAAMAPFLSRADQRLVWWPTFSTEVAPELGITHGKWRIDGQLPDGGTEVSGTGVYVTVWRKQPDGGWRAVYDTGSPLPK